jgi:hypothetical protein
VGDILVIFFCVPFTSTVYTVESWPYGLLVCKFSEFIKDVSIGVSVFTLTALSADRYFAIVDPIRKLTGCRATRITCVTIAGKRKYVHKSPASLSPSLSLSDLHISLYCETALLYLLFG